MSTVVWRGFCSSLRVSVLWAVCIGSGLADGIMELSALRLEKISWITECSRPSPPINDVPAWPLHISQIPPELVDGTTFWSVPWPQSCRAGQVLVAQPCILWASTRVSTKNFIHLERRILYIWKVRPWQDPNTLSGSLPFSIPIGPGYRTDLKVVVIFWKVPCIKMSPWLFWGLFLVPLVYLIWFFCP